jgi:hypothetical protein
MTALLCARSFIRCMLLLVRAEPSPLQSSVQVVPATQSTAGVATVLWQPRLRRLRAIALASLSSLGTLATGWPPAPAHAKPVTAALAAEFDLKPLNLGNRAVPVLPPVQPLPSKPLFPPGALNREAIWPSQACAVSASTPPPGRVYDFATHLDNYGDRLALDARKQRVNNSLSLIVLHETVGTISSVLHLFKRPPSPGRAPVSYHALIARDGTIIQTVPAGMRALGAANSAFDRETVQLNPKLPGSVNNFAYHISLESPADGMNNHPHHSGYTQNQYRALAYWAGRIMQAYGVPWERITTHKAVDRSGSRQDPRSFNWQRFKQQLPKPSLSACSPTPLRSS